MDISASFLFCLLSPGKFLSNIGVIRNRNKPDILNADPADADVGVIKHSNQQAPYLNQWNSVQCLTLAKADPSANFWVKAGKQEKSVCCNVKVTFQKYCFLDQTGRILYCKDLRTWGPKARLLGLTQIRCHFGFAWFWGPFSAEEDIGLGIYRWGNESLAIFTSQTTEKDVSFAGSEHFITKEWKRFLQCMQERSTAYNLCCFLHSPHPPIYQICYLLNRGTLLW